MEDSEGEVRECQDCSKLHELVDMYRRWWELASKRRDEAREQVAKEKRYHRKYYKECQRLRPVVEAAKAWVHERAGYKLLPTYGDPETAKLAAAVIALDEPELERRCDGHQCRTCGWWVPHGVGHWCCYQCRTCGWWVPHGVGHWCCHD